MKQKEKPIAAYLQLYKDMRTAIEHGDYPYGTKLPSKRVIADRYHVSVITSEHAYALLEEEGYILSKERSGYFVSYRENDVFSVVDPVPKKKRTETFNQTGDFPFSVYAKTMRKVLSEQGEGILVKSPNFGIPRLKSALRHYLERSRGMRLEESQIIIGSGAEYLYGLILQALGKNKCYAIETPSYEKIEKVYLAAGVSFERLRMDEYGVDSLALARTKADVLHITPFHSYPTGNTADAHKKREYLLWAEKGKILIEDDFASEFSPSAKPVDTLFSLSNADNVIYLNTFSETITPAIRVGYMVLPKHFVALFKKSIGFYSCTVPTFEQYVLADFIDSGNFERHLNRVRRKNRKEK